MMPSQNAASKSRNLDVNQPKHVLALLSPASTPESPLTVPSAALETSSEGEKPARKRKKHTKSRFGCFPCKTRKIKCDESHPHCSQCLERRLKCTYPTAEEVGPTVVSRLPAEDSGSPLQIVSLNSTGQQFTMTDMQAFHAFLFSAYPNQPFGNQEVWQTRIPSIAYKNEYLMHAMLSQGALYLNETTEQNVMAHAASHRLQAISGIKEALMKFQIGSCTAAECDSLIASMWLISWQSVNLPDAIEEFRTLERGIAIILKKLWSENLDTSFLMKHPDELNTWLWQEYGEKPPIDLDLVHKGIESVEQLKSLCVTETQKSIRKVFYSTLTALLDDPFSAVGNFATLLLVYSQMSTPAFLAFVDPSDIPSQLLSAHINTIYLIFLPIVNGEWLQGKQKHLPRPGLTNSIANMRERLDPEMRHYMDWPYEVRKRVLDANGGWPFHLSSQRDILLPPASQCSPTGSRFNVYS